MAFLVNYILCANYHNTDVFMLQSFADLLQEKNIEYGRSSRQSLFPIRSETASAAILMCGPWPFSIKPFHSKSCVV